MIRPGESSSNTIKDNESYSYHFRFEPHDSQYVQHPQINTYCSRDWFFLIEDSTSQNSLVSVARKLLLVHFPSMNFIWQEKTSILVEVRNDFQNYLITVLLLVDDLHRISLNWQGTDSWAMDLHRNTINNFHLYEWTVLAKRLYFELKMSDQ